ncbi:hypothetical protein IQ230_24145 [Gloeocapsopsis crepidinum LEGE 06123]|uniref:Uncharacterized protein n=1 Tax=Gloeocapsopsis crepidinum LEGE 06123 TaxID=588587 RepID=A0ABR9UYJ1_9CHRO|nr:hypothetical protein [Gloeocapsopsis crepidinum]MBE9193377.1 hypothetical protein [Gloeocapsopsis crepidinum LEGE 06123]
MDSDRPSTPPEDQFDSEAIPTLQRKSIHPDSLKFMDMAKDLLDKPEIKQAMTDEQQKHEE